MIRADLLGAMILLLYYLVVAALLPTLLKLYTRAPKELVRKLHHIAYSLSIYPLLSLFSSWYVAMAAPLLLVLIGYPFLWAVEKRAWYQRAFVDRTKSGGELRKQLLYVQASFALLIAIFWGLLGLPWQYIVAVSVTAWGFGDAAAALIGKAFGRRILFPKFLGDGKTFEGSGAMMLVSALALFLTLLFYAGKPWHVSLLIAILVAPVCAAVELFSRQGIDTLTVPLSTGLMVFHLTWLLSIFGW